MGNRLFLKHTITIEVKIEDVYGNECDFELLEKQIYRLSKFYGTDNVKVKKEKVHE